MLATENEKTERDVRLNIRVDADLHRRLRILAVERRSSSREIVTDLLDQYLRGGEKTGETETTAK